DVSRVPLCRLAVFFVPARGPELELDRDLAVGRFAQFIDLEREVIGAEPVGMASRRALIDSGRARTHLGDLIGHLLAHEMAAEADLAALPDEDFARVREPQMVR